MKLITLRYSKKNGWSQKLPLELDSERTLLLAFSDPSFIQNQEEILALGNGFKKSILVGCSTSGEIFHSEVSEDSISLAVARFEKSDLRFASVPIATSDESFSAGVQLGKNLLGPELKCILILSDGLLVNGSDLLRGVGSVIPPSVTISGGLAGDGSRFKQTWVLYDKKPATGYITAVGLYGKNLAVAAGSLGGWDVFGPERRVTHSVGNVLYELDGKPALALYKTYLGERAVDLPASALLFPLSLRSADSKRTGLVRTVLSVDDVKNTMTFAGDIPEGSFAQLMKANFERLIDGATGAARLVAQAVDPNSDNLALAISCVGRRLVLGARTENETEATLAVLPKGTQQVGFYSYGEISPLANGKCDLHNQTMTLTTISEF